MTITMQPIIQHDRQCTVATQAMEVLLDRQRHSVDCVQCRSDPAWCRTLASLDAEFKERYDNWLRLRGRLPIPSNPRRTE
jgi:hypothetical protein